MPSIKKPQKAPTDSITDAELVELFKKHSYVLGSPKLDGYRCVCEDGAFTSSMKPITNKHIQSCLSGSAYNGLDGEICVGLPNDPNVFNNTTGAVRRTSGKPDFKLYVFDCFNSPKLGYELRTKFTRDICKSLAHVVWIKQRKLFSPEEVIAYEDEMAKAGYEGAMVRLPNAPYKPNRTTLLEENIFKRKPFDDDECVIIGFEEQQQNNNPQTINEKGESTRSNHKENKTGKGTLGAFICTSKLWKVEFKIATGEGLSNALRQEIWDDQPGYLGETIKYKYQRYGSIYAPRIPTYLGFRDPDDMTDI
jgi:DNA ligase-1